MSGTEKWISDIREAMNALDLIDMKERDRQTIFRCLKTEFTSACERQYEMAETEMDGKKWTERDLATLREALDGKLASTWSEEKLNVLHAALKLRRSEKATKRKAIELGLARAVDYWLNKEPE